MQVTAMSNTGVKLSRREQILAALAKMLNDSPGERITTAALAKLVGVSEAALYRHFPSKTKMFEGLIEVIEYKVFTQIEQLHAEQTSPLIRCESIIAIVLQFAESQPGLSRLLVGDALTGETARLRQRIVQFFKQIEAHLLQVLAAAKVQPTLPSASLVHLLMAYIDGVLVQYVRSEFHTSPSAQWQQEWPRLMACVYTQDSRA